MKTQVLAIYDAVEGGAPVEERSSGDGVPAVTLNAERNVAVIPALLLKNNGIPGTATC